MSENIHKGHRQRYLDFLERMGIEKASDLELMEFLLAVIIPQKDVNPLAHELINKFKTLKGVCETSYNELIKINGVGDRTARLLKLFGDLFYKYKMQGIEETTTLNTINQMYSYLFKNINYKLEEKLYCLFIDKQNRPIDLCVVCEGEFDKVAFKMYNLNKLVCKLKREPNYMVFVHNHPSGNPLPSELDSKNNIILTSLMFKTSYRHYDHIIIGSKSIYSFGAEREIYPDEFLEK